MIGSLTAKARTAGLSAYEVEEGTRVLTEEHKQEILRGLERGDAHEALIEATTLLAVMALVGVNIDQLLADLFFALESDPTSSAKEDTARLVTQAVEARSC